MSDQTEPAPPSNEQQAPRRPLRNIILGNTAALPALVTMLNGIAGFAAIHYATKGILGSADLEHLTISGWLIFAAMGFDALDGRLARMTRQATEFGAQLDSLCDAISFGVAPAILMIHTVHMALGDFQVPATYAGLLGKAVMAIGAVYVCCAVLRLARFNIEHAPEVLGHMHFDGLPSPGAGATVAAMVLLFAFIVKSDVVSWKTADWLRITVAVALPAVTLGTAWLMISRFRYPHLLNQFILGKRPFSYIAKAIAVIAAGIVFPQLALAIGTLVFTTSGPAMAIWRKLHGGAQPQPVTTTERPEDASPR